MSDSYFHYKNLTATGTSTISISQAGILHGIVVNQLSTAAATMGIYDNPTTTAAAPNIIGTVQLNAVNGTDYIYDCEFKNGLTVSIGSAATPIDITIVYR